MASWKPEDWEKFSKGYQEQAGGAPTGGGGSSIFQAPIDAALSTGGGALKEAVQDIQSAPWAGQIPETKASPSPVMSWARSTDPQHPIAEKAGRLAADVAPSFLTPELSPITRLAIIARRSGMFSPMVARALNTGGQALWKGAVGGAEQPTTDRRRGAETGAGSALTSTAIRGGYNVLPPRVKQAVHFGMLGLPALAAMESMAGKGGHWFWPWYHGAEALAPAIGAGVAGMAGAPGAAGALGAQAEDAANPESQ